VQIRAKKRRNFWTTLAVVLALSAAAAWWIFFATPPGAALRQAGSAAVATPVKPLRLVSAMQPSGAGDALKFNGAKIASYSDAEIQVAIAVKLEEMNLPVEPLEIRVDDRQVRLEGRVADVLLRDAIEITVRSVPGVRTVDNRLEVVSAE
jgi:hypothetical protein